MADAKKRTNPFQFVREVRQEANKVTWTSGRETLVTTIMVFIMVVIAGAFFFAVDSVLSMIVRGALGFLT